MRVVIAPDKFKGSLTALEAAAAMARGVAARVPGASIDHVPMADGGEGTTQALVAATGGSYPRGPGDRPAGRAGRRPLRPAGRRSDRRDRDGRRVGAGARARREAQPACRDHARAPASCCWRRSPPERGASSSASAAARPTTAAPAWARPSAFACSTTRAATSNPAAAAWTAWRASIRPDAGRELDGVEVAVACDVTNPSAARDGASAVYGPQKGATPEMVERLDRNLAHFAAIVERDLGVAIKDLPGSGAAGGLGGGLVAFAGGKLEPGIKLVIEAVKLAERLENADLCLTGEGAIDAQSAFGKTAVGVARLARSLRLPRPGPGRLDRSGRRGRPRQESTPISRSAPARSSLDQAIDAGRHAARTGDRAGGQRVSGGRGGASSEPTYRSHRFVHHTVNQPAIAWTITISHSANSP